MKLRQAVKGFDANMTTGRKIAKISLRLSLFCVIVWAVFGFVFIITYEIIEHHKSLPVSEPFGQNDEVIELPPGFELETAKHHKSRPVPDYEALDREAGMIIEHNKSSSNSGGDIFDKVATEMAEHHKSSPISDTYDLSDLGGTVIDFQPIEPEKKWLSDETIIAITFFSIVAVVIFIVSFGLTYLGGHIVNGNIGATRLGIVISLLLILGFNPFLLSLYDPQGYWISYEGLAVFLGIVVMPMLVYWGLLWIIKGFLRKATL